jgi:hypothetical protein
MSPDDAQSEQSHLLVGPYDVSLPRRDVRTPRGNRRRGVVLLGVHAVVQLLDGSKFNGSRTIGYVGHGQIMVPTFADAMSRLSAK